MNVISISFVFTHFVRRHNLKWITKCVELVSVYKIRFSALCRVTNSICRFDSQCPIAIPHQFSIFILSPTLNHSFIPLPTHTQTHTHLHLSSSCAGTNILHSCTYRTEKFSSNECLGSFLGSGFSVRFGGNELPIVPSHFTVDTIVFVCCRHNTLDYCRYQLIVLYYPHRCWWESEYTKTLYWCLHSMFDCFNQASMQAHATFVLIIGNICPTAPMVLNSIHVFVSVFVCVCVEGTRGWIELFRDICQAMRHYLLFTLFIRRAMTNQLSALSDGVQLN